MFGCPICSERLDRLPGAQAQPGSTESQQKKEDLRVSCTPCGQSVVVKKICKFD